MPVAADGLALMAALLLGWNRSRGFGAQRRGRMQSAWPSKSSRGPSTWSRRTAADSGAAHDGLAGANRTAIDRLSWHGRRTPGRQTGARRLLYLTRCWTRLLEPRDHGR